MQSALMIVWAYLTLCLILGFFKIPKIKTLKDYALGSGQFSTAVLTFSMIATFVDPAETIGVVGKSFTMGIIFTSTCILHALKWWIMGTVLASSIAYLKMNNCYTLVDIMRLFYGKWGKYVCLASLLMSIAIMSVCYKAAAIVLERYLHIPFVYGAAIITITVAIYSAFGGMHAITITDVLQFFIFIIIIPAVFFIGFQNIDFKAVIHDVPDAKMHINADNIGIFLSLLLYQIIPVTGFPYIQRGLMSSDARQVKSVFFTVGISASIFALMLCTIGMVVAGLNPDIHGDDALFYFIDNTVPSSIIGFVAVSFLAIIMSTASSFLNSITVIIIKDIITPVFPKMAANDKQLMLTRFSGMIIAIAAFGMLFVKDQIIDMLWTMDNFWDPFISIPLIMGLMGMRIKKENFQYVVFSALAAVLIARAFNGSFDTVTLCAGVFVSALMMLVFRDRSITNTSMSPENIANEIKQDEEVLILNT
jgi:Na+/proline symporter